MGTQWRALLGGLIGLALMASPAAAQTLDAPVPRSYPSDGYQRAKPDPLPEILARDTAAADAAAMRCDAGEMAGCNALGTAFAMGAGRPQNRPVAELLYREACDGGDGDACLRLGKLVRFADDRFTWDRTAWIFVRACALGVDEACEEQADNIESGALGTADPAAATVLRRANCARGMAESCYNLALRLTQPERTPDERAEGLALHDRQCRAGAARDCRALARYWRDDDDGDNPRSRAYQLLGCEAGDGAVCNALGTALMRGEWDGGGSSDNPRIQASALFDKACASVSWSCDTARVMREEAALNRDCADGAADVCLLLAEVYEEDSGPLEDPARAARLRGIACETMSSGDMLGDICILAGERALTQIAAGVSGFDPARIEAWFFRGCAFGWDQACWRLANLLAEGTALPADMPRALAIYQRLCGEGDSQACDGLRDASRIIPDPPLLMASADTPPPVYSDEEIAAMMQAEMEAQRLREEEMEAQACTTTEVTFRGATYTDTVCSRVSAIINGFVAKVGSAPWQALLWRPETLGRRRLAMADRVLCGGAVVRPGWVLTAAHCLTDEIDGVRYGVRSSGHRIRLGVYNPLANEGFSYPILNVIPHPSFTRSTWVYDIALVQYDPRAGRKEGGPVRSIATIRLDRKPPAQRVIKARMPAYTFGWGRTAVEGGATPSELRGARLELEASERCTELTAMRDTRRDAVLCAAGRQGQQACFGDSGGPLITYGDSGMGPTVIGVVSSGVKCGTTGVPSRFTRIAHPRVQSWLTSHLPGLR
ncbi:trypsin-like serine protease [Erythrobacter donghaensis]|uniref:trypsin-like serine protease n=1 Tax=Erythrobacter donghaensis TaxID=267135 RepID=UPI0013029773|nr:trypsin-like serine protease [Erythrobacter donghaensis]